MSITETPVRLPIPPLPRGFRVAGAHAGLKRNPTREDISLVLSDHPATAAGVYTTNLVFAAPVAYDRARTPGTGFRAIAVNSGNANACTGTRGLEDAAAMAAAAAAALEIPSESVLVLSTGIIGEFLPLEKIEAGIAMVASQLASDADAVVASARGMMTTDTRPKLAGSSFQAGGRSHSLFGMAKGAAMVGPRMATMLGVILTDAALGVADAQRLLAEATEATFNCVSVDGHTSTNDTVLLLANGAAGGAPLAGRDLDAFGRALADACEALAREIADDGEGATHVLRVEVRGCRTRDEARQIARTVADSPLVKTAIHGADPNWGRIVSAAGYSGVPFDPDGLVLRLNGTLLFENGQPVSFDADLVSASIKAARETLIELEVHAGPAAIRFYSSDLTAEYVHLNADYHT
ncbi:MAG: bifunctional glutamate N-acetyltransferase/amino-acid acetyltransferase ArgJ [Planctomycetia bacterium]|nr:bifunctional glutamate N-acetyltransferase/amino-acid acetyltransferase ArgJ [Planctomycetia bacterium]